MRNNKAIIKLNEREKQLEMVAKARGVIGYGGAFPPYQGLKKKFLSAKSFEKAFRLRCKDGF